MNEESINKLYEILNKIPVNEKNKDIIENIKNHIINEQFEDAISELKLLTGKKTSKSKHKKNNKEDNQEEMEEQIEENPKAHKEVDGIYPKELSNIELEHIYVGLLLNNPKFIVKYYMLFSETYFEDDRALNIYKGVLFTESSAYTPEIVKSGFNFAKNTEEIYMLKGKVKEEYKEDKYNIESIYIELKKLFILRKSYIEMPEKDLQERIVEITNYKLYKEMSIDEVKNAIEQVSITGKFKQSILNKNLTFFLEAGDNNLTNGLELPFPILSSVFKGIRRGETMAFAMPSNSGKSRFTINLAAHTAFVHKKKVLIISNEMSEDKMKLCLITTILNNSQIQALHKQYIKKTEGELLEFKFRADNPEETELDEEGFILKQENETQANFVKRLSKISTEFMQTIKITEWVNKEMQNSIHFINITDHTNDELKKVIMNYYYKEKIEYFFYDTLKTDTANIGNGEEIKKTATILSNLAQNFNIFICSTLQLTESSTLPINLDINDLAVSRTVKEVLDTLCLIKQISRDTYEEYEYSHKEVDTEFFDLEKFDNPDVRYYACVVDKNRAGAKPKLLFRLNLAYNMWEELGYLKLKQFTQNELD